ncbi:MAG: glycosyltransferase family 9 protein [Bacteroidetes bacterium]|nr:glycosyltransferase family 9 protein [Bacteroidota bacterium]MBU1720090.1 glycosyltransferase family 9 protein [Bacteroidota bacterium]
MKNILIIQTAFIGDVVLATPLAEKLHYFYPDADIDFLVRKGNESLFNGHPFVRKVHTWDKKNRKYRNLRAVIREIKAEKYDHVVNLQRYFSSGVLTLSSRGKVTCGFSKNPLSFLFTYRVKHEISRVGKGTHEVERNLSLISFLTGDGYFKPMLYPTIDDFREIRQYTGRQFYTISPASIWFTKQLPVEKWIELIRNIPAGASVFLLGGQGDSGFCDLIVQKSGNPKAQNLAGKLSFLQSSALMKEAIMNYANDSAPLHFASAVNAPVTAFFLSTTPSYGFTPLSDNSVIAEPEPIPACRPCGIHGKNTCPKGHFHCAWNVDVGKYITK